jgi:hypothetical protein
VLKHVMAHKVPGFIRTKVTLYFCPCFH